MRSSARNVLLVAGSAAASIVAVDVALLAVHGPVRVVEDFYQLDGRLGYRMRSNLEFVFANPYHRYRATVRTNNRGLRDDEVTVPKPAGVFRILLLGDSMTAGLEVERQETFEAVCEARLRAHGRVEVVNAGVRGYNIDNILGFLQLEGLSYQPDVVVYLFVDNDLTGEDLYRPTHSDLSRGFTLRGALGRLAAYSHIAFHLELAREKLALRTFAKRHRCGEGRAGMSHGMLELVSADRFDTGHAFRCTARRIARMAELCAQHGAVLLLAGMPQREVVDPNLQAWYAARLRPQGVNPNFDRVGGYLDWVAKRHGIERFDPVPAFRGEMTPGGSFWFYMDSHLNAPGHRLLGQLLAAHLESLTRFQSWQRASEKGAGPSAPQGEDRVVRRRTTWSCRSTPLAYAALR